MPNAVDVSGQIFGRLTAISATKERYAGGGILWRCVCSCGNEKNIWVQNLKRGFIRSCGCLRHEFSVANGERWHQAKTKPSRNEHPLYGIWDAMQQRCRNTRCDAWKYYGGRGIRVCERWTKGEDGMHPFDCFVADLGPRPTPRHSIDRWPDNDGDYEPSNIRWATQKEQMSNSRPAIARRMRDAG